jgi:hypothetical protein
LSARATYTLSSAPNHVNHLLKDEHGMTISPNGYFVFTLSAGTKRPLRLYEMGPFGAGAEYLKCA